MEKAGRLYGIGVGPGDPELMTLKAVRTIGTCSVIAAPRTEGGRMLALEIAAGCADLAGKTILPLDFPMQRDEAERQATRCRAADALEAVLRDGEDAAFLTLGDVSVYSTFGYVEAILRSRGYETERIPGVPSFCAAAARLDEDLAEGREPIHILPAGTEGLAEALCLPGTKVVMKANSLGTLTETLRENGQLERAAMVQNCGLPGEKVCRDLEEDVSDSGYFTTVIVKE